MYIEISMKNTKLERFMNTGQHAYKLDQEPIEMTCAREHATLYTAKSKHNCPFYF